MDITVPISVGELLDKITILEIKKEKIKNIENLICVNFELDCLLEKSKDVLVNSQIVDLFEQLVRVNRELWEIEDNIRKKEKNQEFDDEFINIARSVYKINDQRFKLKNKINEITNSKIKEQKNH